MGSDGISGESLVRIRDQILDVLNSGPKKLAYVVELLEENGVHNCGGCYNGVKPIQSAILRLLREGTIELTPERYLKIS